MGEGGVAGGYYYRLVVSERATLTAAEQTYKLAAPASVTTLWVVTVTIYGRFATG